MVVVAVMVLFRFPSSLPQSLVWCSSSAAHPGHGRVLVMIVCVLMPYIAIWVTGRFGSLTGTMFT